MVQGLRGDGGGVKRAPNHRTPWTKADLLRLRREWPTTKDTRKLVRSFGRTYDAVRMLARRMGLCRQRAWTRQEDATLRRVLAEGYAPRSIRTALPGRTAAAIRWRRVMLGISAVPQGFCGITEALKEAGLALDYRSARRVLRTRGVLPTLRPGIGALKGAKLGVRRELFDACEAVEAFVWYRESAHVGMAAKALGVTAQTVRKWLQVAGRYPEHVSSQPRFLWTDLARWLADRAQATPERILRTAVRMGLAPESVHPDRRGLRLGHVQALPQQPANPAVKGDARLSKSEPDDAKKPRKHAPSVRCGNSPLNARADQPRGVA